jgi:phenylpropionate dioxygenase-like ring-hydroxylating dioxygenase large terminal subunit
LRAAAELGLGDLHWMERRHYTIDCNWKVFVDNYLDGGYHVPHVHRGLDSVLSLQRVHRSRPASGSACSGARWSRKAPTR